MARLINAKLTTGEEIIARIENETETNYSLSNPRTLSLHQTPDGRMAAGFIPTMMLANEGGIVLEKSMIVMYTSNIQKEYEDKYLETVSGLTLATTLRG